MYKETLHGLRHTVRRKTFSGGHEAEWTGDGTENNTSAKDTSCQASGSLGPIMFEGGVWVELRGKQKWPLLLGAAGVIQKPLYSMTPALM